MNIPDMVEALRLMAVRLSTGTTIGVLPWAVVGALGAGIVLAALDLGPLFRFARFFTTTVARRLSPRVQFGMRQNTDPTDLPLMDRLLAPLAAALAQHEGADKRLRLEHHLVALGFPSPYRSVADVYAVRVLYALFGCAMGLAMAVILSRLTHGAWMWLAPPLLCAAIGLAFVPLDLAARLGKRNTHILYELPYAIDRLIVERLSTQSIDAMFMRIANAASGGYVMRELRIVAEEYVARKTPLRVSLSKMAARNTGTPLLERLAERLIQAHEEGTDLVPALETLGERARRTVEAQIKQKGEENRTVMIVPSIIGLIGVIVAMVAPSIGQLTNLGRAPF